MDRKICAFVPGHCGSMTHSQIKVTALRAAGCNQAWQRPAVRRAWVQLPIRKKAPRAQVAVVTELYQPIGGAGDDPE